MYSKINVSKKIKMTNNLKLRVFRFKFVLKNMYLEISNDLYFGTERVQSSSGNTTEQWRQAGISPAASRL